MEILVCVKQVLDTRLPIEVTEDGAVVQREPWPVYVLNPADRCALEEAVRLRDAVGGSRVTALTLGRASARAVLGHCLARGADGTVHLLTEDSEELDPFAVARLLSSQIRTRAFDLVLCGNRTEEGSSAEVGPVLAELLDIAQVTNVVKLNVVAGERKVVAERKLERGYRQVVEASLPALVTVDASISQPRYVTARASRFGEKGLARNGSLVSVQGGALTGQGPVLRRVAGRTPPRPRPKKIAQPDAAMSAEDRMAMLMGGAMPTKSSQRTTGGAESLADEIIAFLREKGLLT